MADIQSFSQFIHARSNATIHHAPHNIVKDNLKFHEARIAFHIKLHIITVKNP